LTLGKQIWTEGSPIEREMLEVAVREVQRIERIVTGALLEFACAA
jgi:hypothetical protein